MGPQIKQEYVLLWQKKKKKVTTLQDLLTFVYKLTLVTRGR